MSYPQYGKRGALDGGYGGYKIPKLSYESPRGYVLEVKVYMCLGRRPPSPMAPRSRGHTLEKSTKSHSASLQPRPTHTPSRRCARSLQPCVLPFVLARAALLTRPRPAQPLLLTADSAGSSVFLSPIGVTIAAARPCMFIECVSAKNACPACARFDACTC